MNAIRIWLGALLPGALLLAALLAPPLHAQTEDVFAFIPPGGRTLLSGVLKTRPSADEVRALLGGKRTQAEWLAYLKGRGKALPALTALDETALKTLADYLSFHMPLPAGKVPADLARADWAKVLPHDGRDLTMNYCQFCHIITVVVTQERPQAHWLGTMNKPSHVEIELNPSQREELANYLVLNGGIPIELVPEDLRAGGASY